MKVIEIKSKITRSIQVLSSLLKQYEIVSKLDKSLIKSSEIG